MKMLIIFLTTVFSLAASADCAVDPNCAMKAGGAGFSSQGPGCADCLKFLNKKRLPQAGSGAFDNTNVPVPQNDDDSTGTDK